MRMYHLGFTFKKESEAKRECINNALNNASVDWVRYSYSAWIAYADSPQTLHMHVREAIDKGDQFLVVPLDMASARTGLLSPWIWEWLIVDRTQPDWRSVVDKIDYPRPPPPAPAFSIENLMLALQPPKDESQ